MGKQWSMDEIDALLETTEENAVSDLVAELVSDTETKEEPAEVVVEPEEALPAVEAEEAEPVSDEYDEYDEYDTYDEDYDDFDEEDGPDVEGVEDLFGNPAEEPAEPEPEFDAPVDEAPEAPAEAEEPEPVFEPEVSAEEGLSDETDYAPGFVDEEEPSEDAEEKGGKPSLFMNKLRAFRESFINVVEGNEPEKTFTDEDYGLAPAPAEDGVERMTGRGKFMDRELATQKTKVFDPMADDAPAVPKQVQEVRNKSALFKGIDENAKSPKMIMELADDKPQVPEEKKALAQKTVGIRPIHNENIEHQILTTKIERTTAEFTKLEDEEMPGESTEVAPTPKGAAINTTVASASALTVIGSCKCRSM
ncbi:MAG: hypothetical protein IKX83_05045 [Clostridia bacterium]|nr:hypothetical protein [Clostridia bacterium]